MRDGLDDGHHLFVQGVGFVSFDEKLAAARVISPGGVRVGADEPAAILLAVARYVTLT